MSFEKLVRLYEKALSVRTWLFLGFSLKTYLFICQICKSKTSRQGHLIIPGWGSQLRIFYRYSSLPHPHPEKEERSNGFDRERKIQIKDDLLYFACHANYVKQYLNGFDYI